MDVDAVTQRHASASMQKVESASHFLHHPHDSRHVDFKELSTAQKDAALSGHLLFSDATEQSVDPPPWVQLSLRSGIVALHRFEAVPCLLIRGYQGQHLMGVVLILVGSPVARP